MKFRDIRQYYIFRTTISLLVALLAGIMWTLVILETTETKGLGDSLFWAIFTTVLLPLAIRWQQHLYQHHTWKVLFMLDAIENNDSSIHFSETDETADTRLVNRALNRVAHILYNVKNEICLRNGGTPPDATHKNIC